MAPTIANFSRALFLLVATTTTTAQDQTQAQAQANAVMADHAESDFLSPATLEQVHVITRHGARTMLSKDADSLAEEGGVSLTPLGQQQLFDLGSWLRDYYIDQLGGPTDGTDRSLEYYNPALHHFESSNLDRTLSSANALTMGLFPSTTRASASNNMDPSDPLYKETVLFKSYLDVAPAIPVYTDGKDKNDITLRTFNKCPTFHERLKNDLYTSDDWKSLVTMNSDLLEKLGRYFPEHAVNGKIPLKEVWQAYDAIHVARTECLDSDGNDLPCSAFVTHEYLASALTSAEFDRLEVLTEHITYLKFGRGLDADSSKNGWGTVTAGSLLGSNLLWKLLKRSKGDGHLFLYSAESPALLGLLSTLQATDDFAMASSGDKFFEYGSALIVEIHKSQDKGKYYFVVKYKSSENATAVHMILKESPTGIKCGKDDTEFPWVPKASWCLLDEVVAWAKINTLTSEEDWCKACNNHEADVCLAGGGRSKRETPRLDAWLASPESMTGTPEANFMICALFFGGFFAGLLLMGFVWWYGSDGCCNTTKSSKTVKDDASTNSYASDDGNNTPVVIEEIYGTAFADSDKSAEKLDGKEIC